MAGHVQEEPGHNGTTYTKAEWNILNRQSRNARKGVVFQPGAGLCDNTVPMLRNCMRTAPWRWLGTTTLGGLWWNALEGVIKDDEFFDRLRGKGKGNPLQVIQAQRGLGELKLLDFLTSALYGGRLSALRTDRLYPQGYSWYPFSLGAESTPGPWFGRKEICH